jgi:hypothetical protein
MLHADMTTELVRERRASLLREARTQRLVTQALHEQRSERASRQLTVTAHSVARWARALAKLAT